jgi:hypothetical protein
MSAVRCPQCRLPLTDEEASGGSCSSCGHELPQIEAPEPKTKAAPTASHDPAIPWLAAGVSLIVAVVAVAWSLTRTASPVEFEGVAVPAKVAKLEVDVESEKSRELELLGKLNVLESQQTQVAAEKEAALLDASRTKTQLDLTAKELKDAETKLVAAKTEIDRLQGEAKQMRDALAGKAEFMPPGVIREIRNGLNDKTLYLSAPRGDYTVDRLVNGSKIKISGAVKRLIVQGLDGGSYLDAVGLKVEEVRVVGPIVGKSTFKLVCEGANVEMGRIDGMSDVVVRTNGGKVKIDEVVGDSKVIAVTKDFSLKDFADGSKTTVTVTLTRDGHASFGELRGTSKLVVQKYDPGDPALRIDVGRVGPNAIFKKLAF